MVDLKEIKDFGKSLIAKDNIVEYLNFKSYYIATGKCPYDFDELKKRVKSGEECCNNLPLVMMSCFALWFNFWLMCYKTMWGGLK